MGAAGVGLAFDQAQESAQRFVDLLVEPFTWSEMQRVEGNGSVFVLRVDVDDVVDPMLGDTGQNVVAEQLVVWPQNSHAVSDEQILTDEVAKQRRLTGPGFPDAVDMVGSFFGA